MADIEFASDECNGSQFEAQRRNGLELSLRAGLLTVGRMSDCPTCHGFYQTRW